MPTGCIENTFVAELSRTTVGFFKPSIRCRPTSKLAGVDLPPFFVPGVMRVGIGQRVLSFVFACAAGAQAQPERKQHTRRRTGRGSGSRDCCADARGCVLPGVAERTTAPRPGWRARREYFRRRGRCRPCPRAGREKSLAPTTVLVGGTRDRTPCG